ncbi:hypothetical protein IQ265_26570 [Nodosilinea sp. LEGE 06152]|uniref:hypothetical protein n=1 Tax=Nodosilinea sp. LEGE 06152 TaxID=2777966 RepID=UPI0018814E10|nr:hypothetical protein [Nodosilinea sp. LEGE 06152]MBE9160357.1 hypothetical protein [Nodosilinea sp. LEGE 06152]
MILVILKAIALKSADYGAATMAGYIANRKKTRGNDKRAQNRHGTATALEERRDEVNHQAKEDGELQLSILQETGCIPVSQDLF